MSYPRTVPKTLLELATIFPNYVRDPNDFKTDKQIGKGGFGVVYHGIDLKTQKEVAVKELLPKHLKGKFLNQYIREIYTMAVCDCRWIVPLIGFSVTFPYSIIIEYEVNGSLDRWIHKGKKLSPTHLTSIAMVLAFTLSHIHQQNIIFRDLKSSNVLIDQNLLPRLCDFGIARFDDNPMKTKKIGTPAYMAPELLDSYSYNAKVDEYAFGSLLYDLSEGHGPFKGLETSVIEQRVLSGEHPQFTHATPHDMQKVILKLWSTDPKERPSFEELFKQFAECKLLFPKADKAKIKRLAQRIISNSEKRRVRQRELPPLYVDIDKVYDRLKHPSETDDDDDDYLLTAEQELEQFGEVSPSQPQPPISMPNPKPKSIPDHKPNSTESESSSSAKVIVQKNAPHEELNFLMIRKPEMNNWPFVVIDGLSKVTPDNIKQFIQALEPAINYGGERLFQSLIAITRMMWASEEACQFVTENKFIIGRDFKYDDSRIFNVLYEYYAVLFSKAPQFLGYSDKRILILLFKDNPGKIIALYSKLLKFKPLPQGAVEVIDILLDNSSSFTNEGEKYIQLLSAFLAETTLVQIVGTKIRRSLSVYISTPIFRIAITAVRAITSHYTDDFNINFDALLTLAQDERYQPIVLSLMIRAKKFPSSRRLCQFLVNASCNGKEGHFALLNFITSSEECALMVARTNQIYTSKLPDSDGSFRILCVLFTYPKIRSAISENPSFPTFLLNCLSSESALPITGLASIIRRSSVSKEYSQTFLQRLDASSFIHTYISDMKKHWSEMTITNGLVLVDHLARMGNSTEFPLIVPICVQALKVPSIQSSAITVLTILSSKENCKEILSSDQLVSYFQSLKNYPNYGVYANQFLTNIGKN